MFVVSAEALTVVGIPKGINGDVDNRCSSPERGACRRTDHKHGSSCHQTQAVACVASRRLLVVVAVQFRASKTVLGPLVLVLFVRCKWIAFTAARKSTRDVKVLNVV